MLPLRQLVFAANGLSALALCVAAASLLQSPADEPSVLASNAVETRLSRLEQQVVRLMERSSPDGRPRRASRDWATDASPDTATAPADGSLAERFADLEETVEELEQSVETVAARTEEVAAQRGGPRELTPERIEELRAVALDEHAEPRPRLLAVRDLASVDGGRTLEVARAMKKLFAESEEEWVRSGAVSLLQGMVEPELQPWLLDTLENDRFSSTREAATEVLSHYIDSPSVRDALRVSAEKDANYDVRAEAQNALDKLDEREANR